MGLTESTGEPNSSNKFGAAVCWRVPKLNQDPSLGAELRGHRLLVSD